MTPPTLTKQRIARQLGQRTRLPNRTTSEVMEVLIEILADQIAAGGRIEIANFLTLDVRARSRVVNTDEDWDNNGQLFEPHTETFYLLRCRPGKTLRARLHSLSTSQPDKPKSLKQ